MKFKHLHSVLFCALLVLSSVQAGDDLAPALFADPGPEGALTWWLHSPLYKQELDTAAAPKNARQGEPLDTAPAQRWALQISPARFVDYKPLVNNRTGIIWSAARIDSQTGGKRKLRGGTYCALKVLLNGKVVLEKAQPTAPMSDEADAEIELPKGISELVVGVATRSGHCGFQLMLADPQQPKQPVAGDRLLVPTTKGETPDSGAAAARALTFVSRSIFVSPGQAVSLAAAMVGSTPADLGQISARLVDADGKVLGPELPARTARELFKDAWQFNYTVPQQAAACDLILELKAADKPLGRKKLSLYLLEQMRGAGEKLQAEIRDRAAKAGRQLPNAALAAEKGVLFLEKVELGEEKASAELAQHITNLFEQARQFAAQEEKGQDPWAATGGYFERAYHSTIDESAQPYQVGVPSAYTNKKHPAGHKYPLVIFLHGYVPSYDKQRWWDEMPDFNRHFEKHDAFLALPFARSNTDFQSCGETDVLDVIAEMKRLYPIDDDRVYLHGYSMGGMGVYTVAAHNPDLFAAGIVLAGRADSPLQNFRALEKFHPFKRWVIEADNPISLCENLKNIPLRIFHGRDDHIISPKEAQRMEARLKEIGCDAQLSIQPGDHWFGIDLMTQEEPIKWLLQQKRKAKPEAGHIKAFRLEHARQGQVAITATNGLLQPLELVWSAKDGTVTVASESKSVLQKRVGEQLVPPKLEGLHKTPQLCGPVREAICRPFLLVYGTTGNEAANKKNREAAERCAKEWYAFTRSRVAFKADKDVTEDEKKNKNLFLFGEEQENALHAAAAKTLPIGVRQGEVTIGERKLPLDGKGLLYIYPSPFGAGRSVVICCGIYYGRSVGVNHKLDLVPDFLLYTDETDTDGTGTNKPVCAGYFDGQWKLNAQSMWWFDK